MRTKREALLEINEALASQVILTTLEVYEALGITENESLEEILTKLFDVAMNPDLEHLPKPERLAIIKTCQILIGELFY